MAQTYFLNKIDLTARDQADLQSHHSPGGKLLLLFTSVECGCGVLCQSSSSSSGSMGPEVFSQATNKTLSLLSPFVKELDELWQAGLSGSDAHESPAQSAAMFDRVAEKSPVVPVSAV